MPGRFILFGIVVTAVAIQADKLESYSRVVGKSLAYTMIAAAFKQGGLNQEMLETLTEETLKDLEMTMKHLKHIDPKSIKVPDMIADRMADEMEEEMKKAKFSQAEIDLNIQSMKAITKTKVQKYQAAH